ncbi:glycosyltransferase family 9 protein [Aliikangiella sp. G2MR2-5]|uniref:glycosyltransferase family 9 protein n=1 Tax=Aliikangiella sp. G2MR2-5 TaxID=2788943 RepID=UPI0018AB0A00|nr:glycosyltransferase family 9 protein [Aliikangiella sp. G2MR2-5]
MDYHHSPPKKICIIRFSSIGDVCHAVASVQAIQSRWPQARITWIIGKSEYELVKGLADIEFIVFDKRAGLEAYRSLKQQLLNREFDILLHMQVSIRASLASLCVKARERWGFDRARARELQWLFTNRKIVSQKEPHVADGFLAFAKAIGVSESHSLQWTMPLDMKELTWFDKRFSSLNRYIVICPAASEPERNWPVERYAAVARHAVSKGFEVVLCGGPSELESELGEKIVNLAQQKPLNLIGKTNLRQLLLVLKNAQLLVAPDTGPVHMAVTVDTPVLGLYLHSNPKRTGPYRNREYVVSHYESMLETQTGKSVSELPWGKRVKGSGLMKLISVEQVLAMFDKVISDLAERKKRDSDSEQDENIS